MGNFHLLLSRSDEEGNHCFYFYFYFLKFLPGNLDIETYGLVEEFHLVAPERKDEKARVNVFPLPA